MPGNKKSWPVPAHLHFGDQDQVNLDNQFGFILARCHYLVRKRLLRKLKEKGHAIANEEIVVLARLYEEDGLTQTEISERTVKNKATVTRLLAAMVRKGMVRKKVDKEDGRKYRVYLTARGTRIMESFLPMVHEFIASMTADIPRRDMEVTTATMKRIYEKVLALGAD